MSPNVRGGLELVAHIELPEHAGSGGFDHAAIHRGRGLLYVAHTANDAVDVIDLQGGRYLRSLEGLGGVAGVLVDEECDLVFTSNRGEDTIAILSPDKEESLAKVPVGVRPNGLAFDPRRERLLCANVGDVAKTDSHTISLVDVRSRSLASSLPVPGRTRWAVFDSERDVFFVNIAEPARIAVVESSSATIRRWIEVPARGPHGLDQDASRGRLYCACDDGQLICLDSDSGAVSGVLELSGAPDVVFLDHGLRLLFVAIGDPGVVDVIDVAVWKRVGTVETERGAHTIAHDESAHRVYAFLPQSHRAAVYQVGV